MFNPAYNNASGGVSSNLRLANWECDIRDVSVESCEMNEDPMGFRVIYYKDSEDDYSVGASYLRDRLKKLSRAGFDAPMTQKAINIIDQKRLKVFKRTV
ncbi:MAG: hypothetical protein ACRBDI_10375 [Alphaproteobacteria bacterium]